VSEVVARLQALGAEHVRELDGVHEQVVFPLPKGLGGGLSAHARPPSGAATD